MYRSRLAGGWFARPRTSPARVVAPRSCGSEPMSLARPTAPAWASTYHATVPSMIALPFERQMAIRRPVRGLRRARKSRGKFLTRGAPEDAQCTETAGHRQAGLLRLDVPAAAPHLPSRARPQKE